MIRLTSWDGKETFLTEETAGILDSTDIEDATVEIRPYNYDVDGKTGCKAYLKEMTVVARKPRRALNARMDRDDDDDEEEF